MLPLNRLQYSSVLFVSHHAVLKELAHGVLAADLTECHGDGDTPNTRQDAMPE